MIDKRVRWPGEASIDNVFPAFKNADGGGRCTLVGLRRMKGLRVGAIVFHMAMNKLQMGIYKSKRSDASMQQGKRAIN